MDWESIEKEIEQGALEAAQAARHGIAVIHAETRHAAGGSAGDGSCGWPPPER